MKEANLKAVEVEENVVGAEAEAEVVGAGAGVECDPLVAEEEAGGEVTVAVAVAVALEAGTAGASVKIEQWADPTLSRSTWALRMPPA